MNTCGTTRERLLEVAGDVIIPLRWLDVYESSEIVEETVDAILKELGLTVPVGGSDDDDET